MDETLKRYGLGLIFAANIFGAGSIFILSKGGISHGYTLLWTLPLSLIVGMIMHDMTARLAVRRKPLMTELRSIAGTKTAKITAVSLSAFMALWGTANFAVFAVAIQELTGITLSVPVIAVLGAGISLLLVRLQSYRDVEAIISVLLGGFIIAFLAVFIGDVPPAGDVIRGFIPQLGGWGYLTMIIAFLGTTVYYPNLWIQSSMGTEKGWSPDDIDIVRKDNLFGLAAAITASVIVLIVMPHQVPSSSSITFLDPIASLDSLGGLATTIFFLGTIMASFTSATGTLFAAGFMIPQAWGHETRFGDKRFQQALAVTIGFGVALIPATLAFTALGPIDMAILFPAVNGIIGLPLTAGLTLYLINRHTEPSRTFLIAAGIVFILLLCIAALTGQSLARSLAQGIA